MVQIKRPKSWDAVVAALFEGDYDQRLGRHRSPYVFRGTVRDWPLTPSLHRLGHPRELIPNIEKALMRNFKKYADESSSASDSEWRWISIAQHHGLPTRLLDWTFSPFVALHFATDDIKEMEKPGVVWMVNFQRSVRYLPPPLKRSLSTHYAQGFSVEILEESFPKVSTLERVKGRAPEFVVFFEPPSLDARIVNQFGMFSLMNRPDADFTEWLERRSESDPELARKVIIPANLKWEIRDKLDQMNMTERVIYPGLDGLSQWLKRWYSPKDASSAKPAKRRKKKAR